MSKKETIWRFLLNGAIANSSAQFVQKEIAGRFGYSLSTVHHALTVPRETGAIAVTGRFFRVRDAEKLLMIWATHRNLGKDVTYRTRADSPIRTIEGMMPPDVIFGACSAYRLRHGDAPADYDVVYVYARDPASVRDRFPPVRGQRPNIIVLRADPHLASFGQTTPDVQTYVDCWNLSEWYAKVYVDALREKFGFRS